jgi:hypothetical protein
MIINKQSGMRSEVPTAVIDLKAVPPPAAQTSLRWRQNANAERMAERASAFSLGVLQSKTPFRYASAERTRTHWWAPWQMVDRVGIW